MQSDKNLNTNLCIFDDVLTGIKRFCLPSNELVNHAGELENSWRNFLDKTFSFSDSNYHSEFLESLLLNILGKLRENC